jgi:hypothetical protein
LNQIRIYVTGCAGSGNTLLRRCFYAFKDTDVLLSGPKWKEDELCLDSFIERESKFPIMVGKRTWRTIFSTDVMSKKQLDIQVGKIKKHNIRIINTIRDGRDVVLSTITKDKLPISAKRWIHSMRHRYIYPKLIAYEVRYEDLVTDPDSIQAQISERFGLVPTHKFSEYPDFIPHLEHRSRQFRDPRYRKRPISPDRIGKDLDAYKGIVRNPTILRHFERELEKAGYI